MKSWIRGLKDNVPLKRMGTEVRSQLCHLLFAQ